MLNKQRVGTFVLGGVVGALAGIFFAPKSGRELRGSIASRAGEARERGRETYFETQERVQERIAEARERSSLQGGMISTEEAAEEPLPKLGPAPSEPLLGPRAPAGTPPDTPPLRDVSRDVPRTPVGEDPDPEEIQRRIQETRSRLRRARLETPEEAPKERDG